MKLALLLAVAALRMFAQPAAIKPSVVTISIAPQGAEVLRSLTGRRITGVGIIAVTVCATETASISGGFVYQALNRAGIATISKRAAVPTVLANVQKSKWKITADVIKAGTSAAALFGAGGIVKMSTQILTALIAANGAAAIATPLVTARIPDPTPLTNALLDPATPIPLTAGGCQESFVLVIFDRKLKAQVL